MKQKWIAAMLGVFTLGCALMGRGVCAFATEKDVPCKAAYLCDAETGTCVYGKDEERRLPIASMCKIMTLLLAFEAVDAGKLAYDEQITVSEHAAGMGGSQVFLEAGGTYRTEDLMRSIAVCSANDSCAAIAERVAGSEEAFVGQMNARAKELGAENTLFSNCTGLPKEPQYSCAKDVSLMLRALTSHEKYFTFCSVWTEEFAHPGGRTTLMTNTNKLVRYYEGCDGGKTGFTNEAGFCLAATAKRGETRVISVVIGAETSKSRFAAVRSLFDYAFGNFETHILLLEGELLEQKLPVRGGRMAEIGICAEKNLTVFCKKGDTQTYEVAYETAEATAPLKKGEGVGWAVAYQDGVEVNRSKLVACEDVPKMRWWDAFRDAARAWN